jgi:hypothetical protein
MDVMHTEDLVLTISVFCLTHLCVFPSWTESVFVISKLVGA